MTCAMLEAMARRGKCANFDAAVGLVGVLSDGGGTEGLEAATGEQPALLVVVTGVTTAPIAPLNSKAMEGGGMGDSGNTLDINTPASAVVEAGK